MNASLILPTSLSLNGFNAGSRQSWLLALASYAALAFAQSGTVKTPRVSAGKSFSGVGTAAWPMNDRDASQARILNRLFIR